MNTSVNKLRNPFLNCFTSRGLISCKIKLNGDHRLYFIQCLWWGSAIKHYTLWLTLQPDGQVLWHRDNNHLILAHLLSFSDPAHPKWVQWAPSRLGGASDSSLLWAFCSVLYKIAQKLTVFSFWFGEPVPGATIWRHLGGSILPSRLSNDVTTPNKHTYERFFLD